MKKQSKKQKEARRIIEAEEQRRIFEQGVRLGLRIAQQHKGNDRQNTLNYLSNS